MMHYCVGKNKIKAGKCTIVFHLFLIFHGTRLKLDFFPISYEPSSVFLYSVEFLLNTIPSSVYGKHSRRKYIWKWKRWYLSRLMLGDTKTNQQR